MSRIEEARRIVEQECGRIPDDAINYLVELRVLEESGEIEDTVDALREWIGFHLLCSRHREPTVKTRRRGGRNRRGLTYERAFLQKQLPVVAFVDLMADELRRRGIQLFWPYHGFAGPPRGLPAFLLRVIVEDNPRPSNIEIAPWSVIAEQWNKLNPDMPLSPRALAARYRRGSDRGGRWTAKISRDDKGLLLVPRYGEWTEDSLRDYTNDAEILKGKAGRPFRPFRFPRKQ